MSLIKNTLISILGFLLGYFIAGIFIGAFVMSGQTENPVQWAVYSIIYGLKGEILGALSSSEPPRVIPLLIEVAGGIAGAVLLNRRRK